MTQIARQTTATTKAVAAVTATSLSEGVQVLPGGFQFRPPEQAAEVSKSFDSNFATLKTNLMSGMESITEKGDGTPSIDFDINSLSASPIIPALVDSLHLKDYGGWYAAVAMAITASQQRSAGRKEASNEFESELELAREKANEAATAALAAADGAKLAKTLAMKIKNEPSDKGTAEVILEQSRMKVIQLEKVSRSFVISLLLILQIIYHT